MGMLEPASDVPVWTGAQRTVYRYTPAYGMRVVGGLVALTGIVLLAGAVTRFPPVALCLLVVMAALIVVAVLRLVVLPPRALELTTTGFSVHNVRGHGVPAARWSDVRSVETKRIVDSPSVVFALADGQTSTLPLPVLGARALAAQREIHARLNSANGYRAL
jgi:hypothetical protein